MIGLLDCRSKDFDRTWVGRQPEMLEFFDRPLLQHAVEQMVQNGVDHCVLITEDTSSVMQRWGSGERWGCTFSAIPPRLIIQFLAGLPQELLMVGRGDCVPCLTQLSLNSESQDNCLLIFHAMSEPESKEPVFTGWALAQPQSLLNQCFATFGAEGLLSAPVATALQVDTCICCNTPKAFLNAQDKVFAAVESAVIFHGLQVRPGVWAARNVSLHPSTKTIGRVYLGENVRIAPNVTLIGPVVICRDSAIDAGCVLSNSCVQPGIYVGRDISLLDDVVIEDSIIRSTKGTVIKPGNPGKLARSGTPLFAYVRELLTSTAQQIDAL